jgi:gas vesicle protein
MYERRGGSVFGAFLLGGLMGAILGLLFAPRSGAETREMLSERANEYWGQAEEMYAAGKERIGEAVDTGMNTAGEKSEELRAKINEARSRLQEQVVKSTEVAKDKLNETAPAVKDTIDKAAASGKTGVDFATGKANEGLDYVASKAATAPGDESAETQAAAAGSAEAESSVPEV